MNLNQKVTPVKLSSKADTLKMLSGLLVKSTIEKIHITTEAEWSKNKLLITETIKNLFSGKKIIVRSSALNEDRVNISNAGAFKSILNVDSSESKFIEDAIDLVISSYKKRI